VPPEQPEPLGHRRVLRIAAPIGLSNATIPLLGAVDTAVVGQLGEAAPIGAVGLGAIIIAMVYWMFSFLRMGTTGLVAQARGAGEDAEAAAVLLRGLLIAGAAGVMLIASQTLLVAGAFRIAPASPAVEALARDYLAIRIWGAPAAIAIYAVTGWLIAMERTGAVLALQLGMNGLNVGLDVLFVLGFGWGVSGVALATLIAEAAGLGVALWLCRDALVRLRWRERALVFDPVRLKRMATVNIDILIRSVILQASFTSFMFFGSGLGDVTLAANQILLQFVYVTAYALDGFAFAAEALVGQAMGARRRAMLRRSAALAFQWAGAGALGLSLAFLLGGGLLIDLMATSEPVRAEARRYLPWMALGPLLGAAAFILDGIFIGATRTQDMRNAMILSAAIYAAAVALLLPVLGNHGLWAALMLLFVVRALTLALRYPALEAAADPPRAPRPS
jgi:multidrug resistance protein, MATE family